MTDKQKELLALRREHEGLVMKIQTLSDSQIVDD